LISANVPSADAGQDAFRPARAHLGGRSVGKPAWPGRSGLLGASQLKPFEQSV
jgi:hypothetical protein